MMTVTVARNSGRDGFSASAMDTGKKTMPSCERFATLGVAVSHARNLKIAIPPQAQPTDHHSKDGVDGVFSTEHQCGA